MQGSSYHTLILNEGAVPALGAAEKSAAQAFLGAPAGCHICSANTTLHVTGHSQPSCSRWHERQKHTFNALIVQTMDCTNLAFA